MKNSKDKNSFEKRTFQFAVDVIKLVLQLSQNTATWVLGKQLIGAATSIDSNVIQAKAGVSKKDFVNHFRIAAKEAKESKRWLEMIVAVGLVKEEEVQALIQECDEIIRILVSSIKTATKK